jgi:hypothetical protein
MPPPVFICDRFHKTSANLETVWNLQSMVSLFSKKNISKTLFSKRNKITKLENPENERFV